MHLDVWPSVHSAAQHRGAVWCRLEGMNLCSRRVIQQLVHGVAMMGADVQNRRRFNFSIDLAHGMVPIGHVEQVLDTVDDMPLHAAGHAIVGLHVVVQSYDSGNYNMPCV